MGSILSPKAPKVSDTANQTVEEDERKAKRSRVALLETEGGIVGSELNPGEVNKRQSLFGN